MNPDGSISHSPGKTSIYIGISIFTLLLLVFYAFVHTIEFDEAWTYVSVQNESLFDILSYKHFNIANNHILNSLWFKILQSAGIKNIFFYRGISIISFVIYSVFLYKAVTYRVTSWKPKYDWYLTLFFMPTVLFFFASGRGYSLALAFFCGSLYYLKVYLQEKKQLYYWFFFGCGIISSLAIVSFFFPFIAMLLYLNWKRYPFKVFSAMNLLSVAILLPLTFYIYHIGKTILLHDVIINGTDNLIFYGMYSTFISSLSAYYGISPWKDLYVSLHMDTVSKIWIIITLIPAAWFILRRNAGKYAELLILLIMTLLFLGTHLVLKSKYPSDRSVSYLFYLIYIPVILYMIQDKNKFVRLHFFSVLFFGLLNLFGFLFELTKPTIYSVMKEKPVKEYTILSDWPNWADQIYNDFSFKGRLRFTYLIKNYEEDIKLTDEKIKMASMDRQADFILLQKANYLRNRSLFDSAFLAQPVLSSNSKEFYLIQRK